MYLLCGNLEFSYFYLGRLSIIIDVKFVTQRKLFPYITLPIRR